MTRQVRGSLFADYVRTVRRHRDAPWERHLSDVDLEFVRGQIAPGGWYPMSTFENLGLAILACVGDWSYSLPYTWGLVSAQQLADHYDGLIVDDDPSATLSRLHGLRGMFFNFDPVMLRSATAEEATIVIDYKMRDVPEAAACYQAMGSFEQFVKLSGGDLRTSKMLDRRWEGKENTVLRLTWQSGGDGTARPKQGKRKRPPTSEM